MNLDQHMDMAATALGVRCQVWLSGLNTRTHGVQARQYSFTHVRCPLPESSVLHQ